MARRTLSRTLILLDTYVRRELDTYVGSDLEKMVSSMIERSRRNVKNGVKHVTSLKGQKYFFKTKQEARSKNWQTKRRLERR